MNREQLCINSTTTVPKKKGYGIIIQKSSCKVSIGRELLPPRVLSVRPKIHTIASIWGLENVCGVLEIFSLTKMKDSWRIWVLKPRIESITTKSSCKISPNLPYLNNTRIAPYIDAASQNASEIPRIWDCCEFSDRHYLQAC